MLQRDFLAIASAIVRRASHWVHDGISFRTQSMDEEVRGEAVDRFRTEIEELLDILDPPDGTARQKLTDIENRAIG